MSSGESYVYEANGNQTLSNIVRGGNCSLRYDAERLSGSGWLAPIDGTFHTLTHAGAKKPSTRFEVKSSFFLPKLVIVFIKEITND